MSHETFPAPPRSTSRALFTRSPGGASETAERVAAFRTPVEAAAREAGVSADLLEGLVFLESAGRPDARAPGGIEGAAGLTQILAETGQNLLDMDIDVDRSGSYTRRLERAQQQGNEARVRALTRARARVDNRFDPAKALAATARYLQFALSELGGREDLALVSYHMGIGNLQSVLKAFGGGPRPYAELYFDSTPQRHRELDRAAEATRLERILGQVVSGASLHQLDGHGLVALTGEHDQRRMAEDRLDDIAR